MDNQYVKIPNKIIRSKNFKYVNMYAYLKSYVNVNPNQEYYKKGMLVSWPGYSKIRKETCLGSTNTIRTHIKAIIELGWIKLIAIQLKNGKIKHLYHLGNVVNGKQVYFIDVSKTDTSLGGDVSKTDTSLDVSKSDTSLLDVSKTDTSFDKDVSKIDTWMCQKVIQSKDKDSIYISKDLFCEDSEDRTSQDPKRGIIIKKVDLKKSGPKPAYDGSSSYRRKGAYVDSEVIIPAYDPCHAAPRQDSDILDPDVDPWAAFE